MILTKVTDFLKQNKKILYYLGFFAFIYFVMGDNAFAASHDKTTLLDWYNGLIQFVSTGVGMLTNLIGVFLEPGWTNATGLGLSVYLKNLWIMISNIVYFVFAILLIVIAFMNILGKGDKWELKQALPKFAIGVLIVPFSWFFIQLILSFSSVLSSSILLLPYDVLQSDAKSGLTDIMKENKICTTYVMVTKKNKDNTKSVSKNGCGVATESIDSLLKGGSAYGMLGVYTYGIFSVTKIDELKVSELDTYKTIFDLSMNVIFMFLMILIYFILLVSLGLTLFVRGIWLWLYMIFSPVFGLLYFFGKEKDGFMDGKFSITEFISLALVPVYVSGALAFGLLFTFVAGQSFSGSSNTGLLTSSPITSFENAKYSYTETGSIQQKLGTGSTSVGAGTRVKFGKNFKLDIYGDWGSSAKGGIEGLGFLKNGIGRFIMQLFSLAVLWIAVIAALSASKITGAVVEPIAAFGKQVGGLISKSPQYMPLFGGQSMKSMGNIGQRAQGYMSTRETDRSNKFLTDHGLFGTDGYSASMQKNYNNAQTATSPKALGNIINKSLNDMEGKSSRLESDEFKKVLQGIYNNKDHAPKAFKEYLKDKEIENLSRSEIIESLNKLNKNANIDIAGITGNGNIIDGHIVDYINKGAKGGNNTSTGAGSNMKYDDYKGTNFTNNSNKKFNNPDGKVGIITIVTKTNDGKGEPKTFNLNTTLVDATTIDNADKDDAISLYHTLDQNRDLLIETLKGMKYTDTDKLANDIIEKSKKQ